MSNTVEIELKKKLSSFSELPSIPEIIIKIKQISEDPRSSTADLANCILSDHQLTGRILRMANSAFYGDYAGKSSTITQAIVLMGFRAVRNIAVSMAVFKVVNGVSKGKGFDRVAFWTRSLSCGVVAKYLARLIGHNKLLETSFVAGFLHDIGQPILAAAYPEKYAEIAHLDPTAPDLCNTERVLLGIDHQVAGEFVAHHWNLPPNLVRAISKHHRNGIARNKKSHDILVDMIYIADQLYPFLISQGEVESPTYQELVEQAQILLGVSAEDMAGLPAICRDQVAEIAKELEVDIEGEFRPEESPSDDIAQIKKKIGDRERHVSFLRNATEALVETKTEDEVLLVVCEAIYRGLQMGRVLVLQYDSKWDSFNGRVGFGFDSQETVRALSFTGKEGLFQHLVTYKTSLAVAEKSWESLGAIVTTEEAARLEVGCFAAIPILVSDEVQYVVFMDAPNRTLPISEEIMRSIESLTGQASLVLERNMLRAMIKSS